VARHRDAAAARGVSRGPVVVVVLLVVTTLLTFGWFKLRDTVSQQGAQAAKACVKGNATLTVVADPEATPPLAEAARNYAATSPVIRDQCVTVSVRAMESAQVLTGLQQGWDPVTIGPQPAAWVAQDSSFPARLKASSPDQLDGEPRSMFASPLVLAVPRDAGAAVAAAGLTWGELPALQGTADGWARYGQGSWGKFVAALPSGAAGSTTTPLAVQAVAAGLTGGDSPTAAALTRPGVGPALTALGKGPAPQPPATSAALTALTQLATVAGSPYQAVPATEQQVYAASQAAPGTVSAAMLGGPAPTADYPYAVLASGAIDNTQSRAASAFAEFLAAPDQQRLFAGAGFRTSAGALPNPSQAVAFGAPAVILPQTDPASLDALTSALSTAVQPRSTLLLDVSGSMGVSEGGSTRLGTITAALSARVRALPDAASLGLWSFSRGLDGRLPYRVDVPTAALSDGAQRSAVQSGLAALRPQTATSLYASISAAYTAAVRSYASAGPNSLLVITDGPNDDAGTGLNTVLSTIAAVRSPATPVVVNVIALGSADIGELTQLTAATGGTVRNVGSSGSPTLTTALNDLLP